MPLLAALSAATGTPGIGAFLFPLLDLLKNEEKPTTPNPNLRLATSLGVGGVGSLRLRPPLCPQHCGPFTAVQVVLDQSIYRPLVPLSPSLPSPMMRRTHSIMVMLARLAQVRH